MRRFTTTLGLGALTALLILSSCSTFDRNDTAAKVNGHELTVSQLKALTGDSTSADTIRKMMTLWVHVAVVGGKTDVSTSAALQQELTAQTEKLLAPHAEEARATYEKGLDGAPFLCLAGIPLKDGVAAADVLKDIDTGMSFADAAKKYSASDSLAAAGGVISDPQSGRECFQQGELVADIISLLQKAKAKVGTAVAIKNTDGTNLIMLLRPFDDLSANDRITLSQTEIGQDLSVAYSNANVWVNSRFGEWNLQNADVEAPSAG